MHLHERELCLDECSDQRHCTQVCGDWSCKINKKGIICSQLENFLQEILHSGSVWTLFLSKRIFLNLFSFHSSRLAGDCSSSEPGCFILVTEMLVTHSLFSSPSWDHCTQFWAPPSKESTSGEAGPALELCEEGLREGDSLSLGREWAQSYQQMASACTGWGRRWSQAHGEWQRVRNRNERYSGWPEPWLTQLELRAHPALCNSFDQAPPHPMILKSLSSK